MKIKTKLSKYNYKKLLKCLSQIDCTTLRYCEGNCRCENHINIARIEKILGLNEEYQYNKGIVRK